MANPKKKVFITAGKKSEKNRACIDFVKYKRKLTVSEVLTPTYPPKNDMASANNVSSGIMSVQASILVTTRY